MKIYFLDLNKVSLKLSDLELQKQENFKTRESHDYVYWLNTFCLRATFGRGHAGSGYALEASRDILYANFLKYFFEKLSKNLFCLFTKSGCLQI